MNKRFLAIAIASTLIAPLTAQAAATVYGKAHVTYGTVDTGSTGTTDNWQLKSESSRFGIKGSEDLGNGLSATYKYEISLDIMSSTINLGARNRYVGLKGDFGEVRVGHHDTPLKMSQGKFDQFQDTAGDMVKNGMMHS